MENQPHLSRNIFFLILPKVHMLDLSGPLQTFHEANEEGANYVVRHISPSPQVLSAQGLTLAELEPLPTLKKNDTLIIAGIDATNLNEDYPVEWLKAVHEKGCRICSVCTGSFVLGKAGLLHGRKCTTHWKLTQRLGKEYPSAQVMENRLFVRDGNLITSAGVASGIDMALSLIDEDYGPLMAGRCAREMVIYIRRDGMNTQESIFLNYRNHLHPGVHKVQDVVINCPEKNPTIPELASLASMSARNLTRVFRHETGITLKTFMNKVKLEVAGNLIRQNNLTLEAIAQQCGFEHPRQLRRLWRQTHGMAPSEWRANLIPKMGVSHGLHSH